MKKLLLFLLIGFNVEVTSQTLTNGQVYDYMPGDVFQWTHRHIDDMYATPQCWLYYTNTYHTDSIISKYYSAASDTVFYSVYSVAYTPIQCNPTLPPSYYVNTNTKFFTNLSMPADLSIGLWSCTPEIDSFYVDYCGKNVWEHSSTQDTICFEAPTWTINFIEGCGAYLNYRGGYGGEPHYTQTLTYYKKGGISCGTYSTLGITEKTINADIYLYPNPNKGTMNFQYSITEAVSGELFIYDLSGREVAKYKLQQGAGNQFQISETELNNGVYFYKMIIDGEIKASDKIVIIK